MFSKDLEDLIQATLEDGVLEDFEKAALIKRAQAEGVDLAELEIYINSILQKRQKAADNEKKVLIQKREAERKEAFGRVCPSCGKQVSPMTLKCECGYEFTTAKATTSVQKLSEKIEEINALGDKEGCSVAEREKRICDAIEMFSVPNTKEDILEFLTLAVSNIKKSVGTVSILTTILSYVAKIYTFGLAKTKPSESDAIIQTRRKKAWRSKFDQVMMKARSLRGDAEFQKQLDYFENLLKK